MSIKMPKILLLATANKPLNYRHDQVFSNNNKFNRKLNQRKLLTTKIKIKGIELNVIKAKLIAKYLQARKIYNKMLLIISINIIRHQEVRKIYLIKVKGKIIKRKLQML
jgi:hypothetical protein